jgi:RimJ/RimL family protein N-acetyltransferase
MLIRQITPDDAELFLKLCQWLDAETTFMLLEPGERFNSVQAQREAIEQALRNGTIFVSENPSPSADHPKLVGYLAIQRGLYRRTRHCGLLRMGVLQSFSRQGIATRLLDAVQQWAQEHHVHRLELTVQVHNQAAITLYQKYGFKIEGTRRYAMVVNGGYVDEYYMARIMA